jgi:hypothetical protein
MYWAKSRRTGSHAVFEPGMHEQMPAQLDEI